MISIKNLTKSFETIIFENFSLDIEDNEITCILGPSGCGKSTLINMILGLDHDYVGKIYVEGKRLSVVFQEDRLFEKLSVSQNINSVSKDIKKNKEVIKRLELEEVFNKPVSQLSGGMKRRVALGRAISFDGDIFILDEPFKGIDLILKEKILEQTKSSLKNKMCIFVTHDVSEALEFADRILILGGVPTKILLDIKEVQLENRDSLEKKIKEVHFC